MTLITAREQTVLRATQASTFDQTGVIKRNTLVSDGAGGSTSTPATVATVACRVEPQVSAIAEKIVGGQLQSQVPWLVTMPALTAVREMDWIEITGIGTFDFISVRARRSNETATVCVATKRAS